jgi:hypothetical protein
VILHYKAFFSLQNMHRKLKFLTAKKIRLKKNQTWFSIDPVFFAKGTQTYARELKEYGIVLKFFSYQRNKFNNSSPAKDPLVYFKALFLQTLSFRLKDATLSLDLN